jgi:hypothetical protein
MTSFGGRDPTTGRHEELGETCPIRRQCLEYALTDDSITGLWRGTTDVERREVRHRERSGAGVSEKRWMVQHDWSARVLLALDARLPESSS